MMDEPENQLLLFIKKFKENIIEFNREWEDINTLNGLETYVKKIRN